MRFIRTYLPEIFFTTTLTLFWTFVFSVTNVGHTFYEVFMSVLLVTALNLCAFVAFHIVCQIKRAKNETEKVHDLLLIIKPDGIEHSQEILKEMSVWGKLTVYVNVEN